MEPQKRIAITGATGQIGRVIIQYLLDAGHQKIKALYHVQPPHLRDERITWVKGDLRDSFSLDPLLEGASLVIHAAGLVSYRKQDRRLLEETNINGTRDLVDACLYFRVEHLIHLSCAVALGEPTGSLPPDESNEWTSDAIPSPYALSKYLAELEVWRSSEEGLPVSVLLPGYILDTKGKDRRTARILERIESGKGRYPGGSRSFIDGRDVARFVVQCLESGPTRERVILTGFDDSFKAVYEGLAAVAGLPTNLKLASKPSAIVKAWLASLLVGDHITPLEVKDAFRDQRFDSARSRDKYGFIYTNKSATLQDLGALLKK